jgi:L-phenylalanine/L-methionine N-acetyltransferase
LGRVSIRHAEPDDYEAIHRILSSPRATAGTLQLPLQSLEGVRKRFFSETREGLYQLVACVDEEVVGHLGLETFTRPRRRHGGEIGMAVRDDWQGKGVGSALMEAALDLADNWLNLIRLELTVYTDNAALRASPCMRSSVSSSRGPSASLPSATESTWTPTLCLASSSQLPRSLLPGTWVNRLRGLR